MRRPQDSVGLSAQADRPYLAGRDALKVPFRTFNVSKGSFRA
jgi:hypothetical protein